MARQCSRRRARKRSGNDDEAAELRCTGGANGVANAQAAAKTGPDLAPPLQKHSITVAAVPHRLPAPRRESREVIGFHCHHPVANSQEVEKLQCNRVSELLHVLGQIHVHHGVFYFLWCSRVYFRLQDSVASSRQTSLGLKTIVPDFQSVRRLPPV